MTSVVNSLGMGLLFSSVEVLLALFFIAVVRKILIRLNYSRNVLLKLWLALPLSLVVYFMVMMLRDSHHYLAPINFNVPIQIQTLSQSASYYFDWKLLFVLAWVLVASWKIGALFRQYIKTKNTLLNHAELMHVKGFLNVYSTELDLSPMAFGLFKPMIIIPKHLIQRLTPKELRLVILHESIHCRRADSLGRFALVFLSHIYWFLPGFSFSREALIEDQELSCDEQVINKSRQVSVYAQLLLTLNSRHPHRAPNESIYCSASFNLKERIMKLNQVNKKQHQTGIIGLFLMSVLAVSSFSAMAQVVTNNNEDIELVLTHRVAPMYPFTAVKENISGQVTLEFTVTQDGRVINAKAVDSTPADIFDKAAVKAIEQWTFEPIEKATQARQVIEFELDPE